MVAITLTGRFTRRALAAPALVAGAAAAFVGYVAAVDPNVAGHYPTCPFLALTGQYCPGCGSLRAVHALAHGDVGAAIGLNVLAVAVIPVLVVVWLRWTAARRTGRRRAGLAPAWAVWALAGLVGTFWLVRNLPFGAALAP